MMEVTKEQYEEAMKIVNAYNRQEAHKRDIEIQKTQDACSHASITEYPIGDYCDYCLKHIDCATYAEMENRKSK